MANPLARKGLKILLFVFLVVVLAEGGVRLFFSNPNFEFRTHTHIRVRYSSNFAKMLVPNQTVYAPMTDTEYHPKRKMYNINRQGFRGAVAQKPKPAGEMRVLVMGGSHVFDTEAYDYMDNAHFCRRTESRLQKRDLPLRVINLGIPGQDIRNILLRLDEDVPGLEPDVVVLCSEYNDLKWIYFNDTTNLMRRIHEELEVPMGKLGMNPLNCAYTRTDSILGWSALYRNIRDVYWRRRTARFRDKLSSELQSDTGGGLKSYEAYLRRFVCKVKAMGGRPVLAIEERYYGGNVAPASVDSIYAEKEARFFHSDISAEDFRSLYDNCDALLRRVAIEEEVVLMDYSAEFAGRREYFADMIHFSPEGSEKAGELFAKALEELLIVRDSSSNKASAAGSESSGIPPSNASQPSF